MSEIIERLFIGTRFPTTGYSFRLALTDRPILAQHFDPPTMKIFKFFRKPLREGTRIPLQLHSPTGKSHSIAEFVDRFMLRHQ